MSDDAQELGEVLEVLGSKGPAGIGAILDVVTEKVPALLGALRATFFSPQAGEEIGKGVGAFYREMVAAGVPEADALAMTRSYLSTLKESVQASLNSSANQGQEG